MRASLVSNLSGFAKLRWRCGKALNAFTPRFSSAAVPGGSLEKIHDCLKKTNAGLWRELRGGALAGCYVGLYSVRLNYGSNESDWRELNRKTVSCLRGFTIAQSDKQRHSYLEQALERIAQKLGLVQLALKRKADTPTMEESRTIQSYQAELYRLSCLLGACHQSPVPC
jgi:hypothetical protein